MSGKAYRIKLCWGIQSGQCSNLLQQEPTLQQDMEKIIETSGWPQCLNRLLPREIRPLDQFSISVSGCPNGCSRPQIADLGLLQAKYPGVNERLCSGCGQCGQACREGAINADNSIAYIDEKLCLSCGACIRSCPEGSLTAVKQGYRVQVGGKLGRHPRLGEELPGIHSRNQIIDILSRCLWMYQNSYRPGLRFGQLVEEQGAELVRPEVK